MTRNTWPIVFALLLLTSCRAEPSKTAPPPVDAPVQGVVFSEYAQSPDHGIEIAKEYTFAASDRQFRVDRSGRVTCHQANAEQGAFQLDLTDLPYLEELQFLPYKEDVLVLLYELSDGEGGVARISRVHVPTCELVFTTDIPGFNLGHAALEGSSLYVSAIGFVGRFDIETWGYDWTHGNLYERHRLNAFGKPIVFRDRVTFPEATTSSRDIPRNVVVQKESGALAIGRRV